MTGAQQSAVADTVRQVMEDLYAASDAHDAGRMVQDYAEQDAVSIFDNGRAYTPAAYKVVWDTLFASIGPIRSRRSDVLINVLNADAATVAAHVTFDVTRNDGRVVTGRGIWTAVLQRRPEGWRILQSHESELDLSQFIQAIFSEQPTGGTDLERLRTQNVDHLRPNMRLLLTRVGAVGALRAAYL